MGRKNGAWNVERAGGQSPQLTARCFFHKRVGDWYGAETIDRKTINKQWGEGVARSAGRPGRHGLVFWGLIMSVQLAIDYRASEQRLYATLTAAEEHAA